LLFTHAAYRLEIVSNFRAAGGEKAGEFNKALIKAE
jgi:hypothetical protein